MLTPSCHRMITMATGEWLNTSWTGYGDHSNLWHNVTLEGRTRRPQACVSCPPTDGHLSDDVSVLALSFNETV